MAYTPKTWTTGETITAAELNAIEQAASAASAAADTANTGLTSKVNSSTYTAGLAGKADLVSGAVPDAQLPTRLSASGITSAIDARGAANGWGGSGGGSSAARGVYDPASYGAVYDGTTDDHAAVQAAIDAAHAAGGGLVQITGQLRLNTTVNLRGNVTMQGFGANTQITGNASPVVAVAADSTRPDRYELRDLLIQGCPGTGIDFAPTGGAYQLGWPRVTVENVTVTDAGGKGVHIFGDVIEVRLINVVTLRCTGIGIHVDTTDTMLVACTAAQGHADGFSIQGGNTKMSACKGYGNTLNGFSIGGAGRHMLSSCEAQDNGQVGFDFSGNWSTAAACLADSNGVAGFRTDSNNALQACSAMYGGGGSGQMTPVGFMLGAANRVVVSGVSNCATAVTSTGSDCSIDVKSPPAVPDPPTRLSFVSATTSSITLSWTAPTYVGAGPVSDYSVRYSPAGAGTWSTVAVGSAAASFAVTGLAAATSYDFQVAAVSTAGAGPWSNTLTHSTGAAAGSAAFSDNFNRADGPLGTTPVGGATWIESYTNAFTISSNTAVGAGSGGYAYINSGATDHDVTATLSTFAVGIPGLVIRLNPATSNYLRMLVLNDGHIRIDEVTGGSNSNTIAEKTTAGLVSNGSVLRLAVTGSAVSGYVGGSQVLTATTTLTVGTRVGLIDAGGSGGDHFDDFAVSVS